MIWLIEAQLQGLVALTWNGFQSVKKVRRRNRVTFHLIRPETFSSTSVSLPMDALDDLEHP